MMFSLQKITALLLILALTYGNDASAKSKTLKNSDDSSNRVARGIVRQKANKADQKKTKRVVTPNSKENPKAAPKGRKLSGAQQRKVRELVKKSLAKPSPSAKKSRISRSQTQPTKARARKKADLNTHSVKRRKVTARIPSSKSKSPAIKRQEATPRTSPARKPQVITRAIPGKKIDVKPKASPARKPATKASVKKPNPIPVATFPKKSGVAPKTAQAKKPSSGRRSPTSKKEESKKKNSGKAPVFEAPKEYGVKVKDLSKDQKKKTEQYLGEGLYKEGTIRFAHPDLKAPDYDQFLEIMKQERKNKGKKTGKSLYTFEQHYQNPKYEPAWLSKPILSTPKAKFGPFAIR
ncbi:MAG: hypothetical protein K2P93_05695 [Alphaproteobacteria bacterium]|nr:hypothetical protein [Alphaproteobacteria bacterium]